MSSEVPAEDLPLLDLKYVVRLGLARGGSLLSAGEYVIAHRILGLEGEVGRLSARLSGRVPTVFAIEQLHAPGVEDPTKAIAELHAQDLTSGLVLWPERAKALTRPELVLACKKLGLRRGGRHAELVERLHGHVNWRPGRWLRVRHKSLIRRLERWAFLRRHRDRSTLVVQRLGHVIWPDYVLTDGPGLHTN